MTDAAADLAGACDRQYATLLEPTKAVAARRELADLVYDLAGRLRDLCEFRFFAVLLRVEPRDVLELRVLETAKPDGRRMPSELPVEGSTAGWVLRRQQPFVTGDACEGFGRFPVASRLLADSTVRSILIAPMTTADRCLGVVAIASDERGALSGAVASGGVDADVARLEDGDRAHVLRVLGETNWVIGGPREAAARLGHNRTTRNNRLRKLGIRRPMTTAARG